ncbi:MAG: tetratricopeptide repeat protein [Planctomycetes bacterium]|nr:tetratricopeptide repeat protein [Planctomycetota bacterium]
MAAKSDKTKRRNKSRNTGADVAPVPATAAGSGRQAVAAAIVLAVVTILVYLPSLRGEFLNWDDGTYVRYNGYLHSLSWKTVGWAFTSTRWGTNWHPLTWLSHAADVAVFGLGQPWGHHLTSILLHGLNAALLVVLMRRMTGRLWPAIVIAALFALHPLRVECVSWISERKELLCTTFILLTLLAYLRYAAAPSVGRYLLVAVAFAAALLSKPMAVTVPAILLLLDGWPLGRLTLRPWRWRPVIEKLPLAAMTIGSCLLTMQAQVVAKVSFDAIGLAQRVANAVVAAAAYLGKFVWPAPGQLLPFYSLWQNLPQRGVPTDLLAVSAAALAALTVAAIVLRKRHPYLLVGWLWYLGTLVPVIGLVQVGSQRMADRYTYLPLIGPVMALVLLADHWLRQREARARSAAVVAALALAGVWAILTIQQQAIWRDTVTLWRYTTSHGREADSPAAWTRMGDVLSKVDRWSEAAEAYRRAIDLRGGFAEGHAGLAQSLAKLGDREQARVHGERAVALKPHDFQTLVGVGRVWTNIGRNDDAVRLYREALAIEPGNLTARSGLAQALARGGQWEAAIEEFEGVLADEPAFQEALTNYGLVLLMRGQYDRAIDVLHRALENDPQDADALCNLGTTLSQAGGRWVEAAEAFERALKLEPRKLEAYVGLAEVAEKQGRYRTAVPHWRKVVELQPQSAVALFRLSRAQAEAGDTAAAIEGLQRVLQMSPGHTGARQLLKRLQTPGP